MELLSTPGISLAGGTIAYLMELQMVPCSVANVPLVNNQGDTFPSSFRYPFPIPFWTQKSWPRDHTTWTRASLSIPQGTH